MFHGICVSLYHKELTQMNHSESYCYVKNKSSMLILELRKVTLKGNCRTRTSTFKFIFPLIVSDRTLVLELCSYQLSTASTALRICTHLVKSVSRIQTKLLLGLLNKYVR